MSNQTISEAARKAARQAWDYYHPNREPFWGRTVAEDSAVNIAERAVKIALDAAARVEPTDKDTTDEVWKVAEYDEVLIEIIGGKELHIAFLNNTLGGRGIAEQIVAAHNASLPATPTPQGQTSEETGHADFARMIVRQGQAVLEYIDVHRCSSRWEENAFNLGFESGWMAHKRESLTSSRESRPAPTERETKSGASLGAATDKGETALCPYHGNYYSPAQCGVCSKIVAAEDSEER